LLSTVRFLARQEYAVFAPDVDRAAEGVMVTHRNISLMNDWSKHFLGITEADSAGPRLPGGRSDVIPVPGTHLSIVRSPHVDAVARRLADWL
jgi:thioesterase domain-containing protein